MTFSNGAFASATYSGYAHFDSDEFMGWVGEMGAAKDSSRYGQTRKALAAVGAESEPAAKNARNYGGAEYAIAPGGTPQSKRPEHQHFGVALVSCDHADLRPTPNGIWIYGDLEQRFEPLPPPGVPRFEVIDELYNSVVRGISPVHSGQWSLATMEVCLAILASARDKREITLDRQVAVTT